MRSADAHQWAATIKNSGMRQEEIRYAGVVDDLDCCADDEKFSKEEILTAAGINLGKCQIRLLTERSSVFQPDLHFKKIDPEKIPGKVRKLLRNHKIVQCTEHPSLGYRLIGAHYDSLFGSYQTWMIFDDRWKLLTPSYCKSGCFRTSVDAVDAMYSQTKARMADFASAAPSSQYLRYSMIGKNRNYRVWMVALDKWPAIYDGRHFSAENIVLHIRTAEWEDVTGRKLLLVEEIQSDWHADGKSYGYYDPDYDEGDGELVPEAPFTSEWHELGIKVAIWLAVRSGISHVAFTTGHQQSARWGAHEGLNILYEQLIPKALKKIASRFHCDLGWADVAVKPIESLMAYRRGSGWVINPDQNKRRNLPITNEAVALNYLKSAGKEQLEKIRVLEISSELSGLVKAKGIPLFGWWEANKNQPAAKRLNSELAIRLKDHVSGSAYVQRNFPNSLNAYAEATRAAFSTQVAGTTTTDPGFNQFSGINPYRTVYVTFNGKPCFMNIPGHEVWV